MKDLIPIFFMLLFGVTSCSTSSSNSRFNINMQLKTSLENEGLAEFFYWDFEEDKNLWEVEIEVPVGIKNFRDSLKNILGDVKFKRVIIKESTQSLDEEELLTANDGDKRNAMMVHTGKIGHIRAINSLEAQILNYQLVKYPLISHPTEFHGFIAYNESQQKYRVYFGASDQPWPPHPDILLQQLNKDVKKGWQLKYHLHNHYEPESNNYLGILAPSMADAQYYKMLLEQFDLEKALITNGFHTVEIESKDFFSFESH